MPLEPIDQYLIEEFHIKPLKPVKLEYYSEESYYYVKIEDNNVVVISLLDYARWLEEQWKNNRNK